MKNYIIKNHLKTGLHLTPEAAEALNKYTPRGCPFENYTMFDLLSDLIKMYSWKIENGRHYNIIDFLDLTNDAHAVTYKTGFIALLSEN